MNRQDTDDHMEVPQKSSGSLKRKIFKWRRYLILLLSPLLLIPIPLAVPSSESRCAYCILLMAIYWVTEVVPLAVTALLPLVLFPLLGVVGSKEISPPYFSDTNVLFMGGLIVAVAIEHWMLHKRIALRVLLIGGTQPRRLMLGFMIVTAFLSMWISNTATTAMMVPIAEAVLAQLKQEQIKLEREMLEERRSIEALETVTNEAYIDGENNGGITIEMKGKEDRGDEITEEKTARHGLEPNSTGEKSSANLLNLEDIEAQVESKFSNMSKMLLMSIAYAANIGGTATLTGTAPNLVLSGQVSKLFPKSPGIGFATWFMFAFPEMVILLIVSWIWLQLLFLGLCIRKGTQADRKQAVAARKVLQEEYKALGPMSFAEKAVLGHFILLALMWLFRDPKFMPGWSIVFKKGTVSDGLAAMIISFSLFIFPSEKPKILCWNPESRVTKPPPPLLSWQTAASKLPWNIIILLGSGFALAKACKDSGLSLWLGTQLTGLQAIPPWAIVAVVCVMITTFTEVTSNTATATIFLPILASLGESIQVNPWYLMIPATVSCSFAFMLPVATPPNAIVFAGGQLKVSDMAKTGFGMNLICCAILMVCINTYGSAMFDLKEYPSWAAQVRNTTIKLVCENKTVTL